MGSGSARCSADGYFSPPVRFGWVSTGTGGGTGGGESGREGIEVALSLCSKHGGQSGIEVALAIEIDGAEAGGK